jgi:Ca2+-binding RTX toxin-like protein
MFNPPAQGATEFMMAAPTKVLTTGNDNYDVLITDGNVYGLDGLDIINTNGAIGSHDIYGGAGDKFIGSSSGTINTQYFYGGFGSQTMSGGSNGDYFYGGDGHVLMTGGVFNWSQAAGSGTVAMFVGDTSGDDFFYGGHGAVAEYGFDGNDLLIGSDLDDSGTYLNFIDGGLSSLGTIKLGLFGGDGLDKLYGGRGSDDLFGGTGVDRLDGGEGSDVLYGGTGADIMLGGSGDDVYEVDNVLDVAWEVNDSTQGIADNVFAYVNFALADGVDNLIMVYGNQQYGYGNNGVNIIIANAASNVLEGKGGYDTITGGAGSDYFLENAGFGVDVITDFTAGAGTQDAIVFNHTLFANFAAVMAAATQHGADTWITASNTEVLVLSHVLKTDLHSDDFQFS